MAQSLKSVNVITLFVEGQQCAELAERGVSIVFGPVDRPCGVRNAASRDPDGHIWAFSADIPVD